MKTGVIDVGGGFRGIYACGALDYCLDNNIKFDLAIGISAGSANLASFIAGQRGRNFTFYTVYGLRKQYASLKNFIKKRSFIDMDYVYGTLSNHDGENPVNYPALRDSPTDFIVVAENAITGEAVYFDKRDIEQDKYGVFKASSSIPFVCKPYIIDGVPYYDGALGDTIPLEKAFSLGCERVVLLLTRPENLLRTPEKDNKLAALIQKKYPVSAERLRQRADRYNAGVKLAQEYAKEGRVLIVSPDDTCGVSTLSRDPENMKKLYEKGYADAKIIKSFIYQS